MAITSMTGFGRIETKAEEGEWSVEIKSVNNRYLEYSLKIPRELQAFEFELKDLISKHLRRGSVFCAIQLNLAQASGEVLQLNEELAAGYLALSADLVQKHGLSPLSSAELLRMPDVLGLPSKSGVDADLWEKIKLSVVQCLEQVKTMRCAEGENLAEDLRQRLGAIASHLDQVELHLPQRQNEHQEKMRQRLQKLLGEYELDEQRLYQEVAVLADKMDITEEIVRFRSHNQLFLQTLQSEGPHGKKLNFLLQEMGREANTLGTKSLYAELQHIAIALKEEIETIREQVQNLE